MLSKKDFKHLFDKYFDSIRSFIFYRCGDSDASSDMAQDVFMKIWEKRENLYCEEIKPLLYKIANDMVISNYRKNSTRWDYEQSMEHPDEKSFSPEEELNYKELKSKYSRTLKEMPENQRIVFLMSRNDELKYHQIAEYLNLSVKAVEKRMSAALSFLKYKLL